MPLNSVAYINGNKTLSEFAKITDVFPVSSWFCGTIVKFTNADYWLLGDNNANQQKLISARGTIYMDEFNRYKIYS